MTSLRPRPCRLAVSWFLVTLLAVALPAQDETADRDLARLLANLDAETPWLPGWWFVDSAGPGTTAEPEAGFGRRATFPGEPRRIRVGPTQSLALVGTQRLSLLATPGTAFSLGTFEQKPFTQDLAHDRAFEPSNSRQSLTLHAGTLALQWAAPSPMSDLVIITPGATVTMNAATLVLSVGEADSFAFVEEGTARIAIEATGEAFLLNNGWRIDLREARRSRPVAAASRAEPEAVREARPLIDLAQRAAERVWFFETEEGWRGRVLIGQQALD